MPALPTVVCSDHFCRKCQLIVNRVVSGLVPGGRRRGRARGTFVRAPDGTLWYAPGVWRDASGAQVDSPPALATAEVESGEVVDADGTTETTGPTRRERSGAR